MSYIPVHVTFRWLYRLPSSWEFISNLDYEYSVITGKRKFTWTFPACLFSFNLDHRIRRLTGRLQLYVGCRWCPLFAIISQILGFDTSNKINCHVRNSFGRRVI